MQPVSINLLNPGPLARGFFSCLIIGPLGTNKDRHLFHVDVLPRQNAGHLQIVRGSGTA